MNAALLQALDDRALAGVIAHLPAAVLDDVLAPVVAQRTSLDLAVVGALLARLPELTKRETWLAANSPWRGSLPGRWLLAQAWSGDRSRWPEALELWAELIEQSGRYAADALYERARVRRETGDLAGSVSDLISCAQRWPDYALLSKTARLLDRLVAKSAAVPGRKVRIGIVSSSTTELMPPLLRLLAARDGLVAEVYAAPFSMYRQELMDPASGLHQFKPDFIVVALHWRDAGLEPLGNAPDAADRVFGELEQLWAAAQRTSPCTILQHAFDFPAHDSAGLLSAREAGGRAQVLAEVNRRLFQARTPGVVIVDCPRLATQAGAEAWSDEALWHVAKQHPAAPSLPLLLDRYVRLIAARVGLAKKVLVLDLDNTLWSGVVGEDGPHGIKVGPPTAIGEAHAALQRYALELKNRGVLLAVCSKNNDADAREPFRSTLGMVLKEDDFALFVANWEEKPANLREIARRLNLGIDSLVFVDDNPLERAKVRRELPEVAVVELPADPAGYIGAIDRGGYFEALALSAEDLARNSAYQANASRDALKAEAGDVQGFLRRLDMRMHHGPFNDAVQDRVVQLLNKTNQFNVTTRRHGAAEVSALRADPAAWTQYFRLVDCFGDNGLIGLLIARPAETADSWEIDTLLMSCRVLGRQAEEFMIATLLAAAQERGIARVRGRYLPTAKNGMVADLFPRLGFVEESRTADGAATFVWDVRARVFPPVAFVRSAGA
ncbi:MAG: HAD family hydrolase [Verrucomicrobia bacterium]|nr:HAD family hydrolase [Verrucomicrobiota bacterium]